MIRVFKNYNNRIDEITDLVKSCSISGSLQNVSRELSCSIVYCITDKNMTRANTRMQVAPGTKVWVMLDNKEIFRGIVIDRELNANDELQFTAFDYAYYLTQNKVTYNFSNTTADRATKQILKEIGVQAGNVASSNIKINRLIAQKSVYEAIQELYSQVSKQNRKQYFIVMDGTKVNVIEMGSKLTSKIIKPCKNVFTGDGNLLSFSYKDSMGNMVNRVKIYDENNKYIGKVDDGTIKNYGLLQENYVKEEDKNPNIVARSILHSIDRDVSVEILGDWNYRTGYAAHMQIPYISTLQNALMYVISDTHTWDMETNAFSTSLELSYVNKMDAKE